MKKSNMRKSKIAIFGASGFSREVADICFSIGYSHIVFIDISTNSKTYFGHDIVGEHKIFL